MTVTAGASVPNPRDGALESRRASIVSAAERVFVRRGFDAATMQEIASEAGISAGNIYRYFEGKEDLIRAAVERCEQRSASLFQVGGAAANSPRELLLAAGHEIWHRLTSEGARAEAVLNLESTLVATRVPSVAAPLAQAVRSTRMLLVRLIAHAKERGEIDAAIDATALATLLIAATGGMQTLMLQLGEDVDVEAVWGVLNLMVEGITVDRGRE